MTIRSIGFIASLFLLFSLIGGVSSASTKTVEVSILGSTEKIAAIEEGGIVFFSFSRLAEILGGESDWETVGHTVVYSDESGRFEFLLGSPYFKLNDTIYNMTYPAELRDGQLFVPGMTFIPFLDRVESQKITFDNEKGTLRIDSEFFNVTDLNVSSKANGILIEINLTQQLAYEIFVTEGNWVNVSIRDGKINSHRIQSRRDSRYMYQLKTHQAAGSGQVSFRLKRNADKWHHKFVSDPPRIQISITDVGFEIAEGDTTPTAVGPDNKIDVIVIDAGHGGGDYGAIGPSGAREKEVVLDIAKRLAKLIRKDKEFQVIMTRDRDKTLTLDQRAEIANKAKADLFISIHANASPKRHVRGWNVFFLAQAKNDSARAVEQLENSIYMKDISTLDRHREAAEADSYEDFVVNILNDMLMTEFQAESYDFATMVDREFRRELKSPARGVDQAGFFVLNKVYTPSILIEAGFISNKNEEKMLKSDDYQQAIAESIYRAIKRFKAKYEAS